MSRYQVLLQKDKNKNFVFRGGALDIESAKAKCEELNSEIESSSDYIQDYLTAAEVSELTGFKPDTVKRWCINGLVPGAVRISAGATTPWLIPSSSTPWLPPERINKTSKNKS